MATIDPAARALLEAPNYAHVATLRKDGTIHNVPVWVDVEGDDIVLNTALGRAWANNLQRTGQITVTVQNIQNPYEYVTITGHLAGEDTETADAHIDALAKKYMGVDTYPMHNDAETRVKFAIAPDRVRYQG